ncbi:TPA: phytanoyl-CoA dioxygenase family protein [Candidatus Poribacteria bacterium]|nr:phytanoyl-CoA dioxygenase family protein [Candidatus Poribacteria bacterium]HIB86731.1 phytanoyl-CoA dioxygenase family protein [Candidatus Poribacteria bacterium]HIC03098.1 phytanoyl-CoA dioxygenase family protein [Candidatus Poribacteria bacterium]HIO07952.1 phytanoyl-CoA dioxygenase family protein [Candidatus Poribacteria bacterium]HIO80700.1 phytanoyl-CoA dioxygenase family protein [Candidatus Poribacteria bacterium]
MPVLSAVQVDSFHQDGYVLVQQMLDSEEINLLRRTAKSDRELDKRSYHSDDGEGGLVRLSLWNHPGNSIYGMVARCNRIVNSMEKLLDGEVYHYHSKMILKDAKVGGAWTWHQDYGYWYQNGLLFPRLASVMIAVDPATRENGCLQVLAESHHMGRLNHVTTGEQAGADKEKVDQALKRLELIHCEMEPGDALFFHCNLLHHSDQNRSEDPRWTLICCYNSAQNNPYKDSHHPSYTPLEKVDDQAIKTVGMARFEDDDSDVAWLEPEMDASVSSLEP